MQIYLAEITAATDAAGTTAVLRYGSGRGYNAPTAPGFYDPRIIQPANLRRTAFSGGTTAGSVQTGYGEMVLSNVDGGLDALVGYGFDGQPVSILIGDDQDVYGNFTTLFKGTLESASFTWSQVSFKIRDRLMELDGRQIQPALYQGTNILPVGLDGTSDDLKGQAKPKVYGQVLNVSAINVNTSKLIYQVNDGAIYDVTAVYDKGVPLTRGSDYTSQVDMTANAPSASNFRVWKDGGYFRLGSQPAGQITCDVSQGAAAVTRTNSALYSEALDNAAWSLSGATLTSAAVVKPSGVRTGYKLVESSATGAHTLSQAFTGLTAGVTMTASILVRQSDRQYCVLMLSGTKNVYVSFDLSTGAVTVNAGVQITGGTGTFLGAAVAPDLAGWFRLSITGALSGETAYTFKVSPYTLATAPAVPPSYAGDGTSGLYLADAQVEIGATNPTAYIGPTAGTALSTTDPIATSTAQILKSLATGPGRIAAADIYAADVTALDALNASAVGIWLPSATTVKSAMEQISNSAGAWFGFDRLGQLRMQRIDAPAGSPVAVLTRLGYGSPGTAASADIVTIERAQTNGQEATAFDPQTGTAYYTGANVPCYKVTVRYGRCWTRQLDANLGGDKTSVSDVVSGKDGEGATISGIPRRNFLASEWRTLFAADASVQFQHRLAPEIHADLLFLTQAAANTEAARRLAIYKVAREMLSVRVELTRTLAGTVDLGSVVSVAVPRFGYDAGKLFLVTGIELDAATNTASLDLFG